jgi:hypothetical protein
VDHPDEHVVDGDRRTRVTGLAAHLVEDGSRLVPRTPGDATGLSGRAAQLARDLTERRVGPETVDLEAVDAVDRCTFAGSNWMTA